MNSTKYNGKACRKCGSTLRYASNNNCVECKHRYDASDLCKQKEHARNQTPKRREYSKIYRKTQPSKNAKFRWRLKVHNLTPDEYTLLLTAQNHQCAICYRKFDTEQTSHIDHSHKTGKTRGLLCGACNRAIGLLQDDPEVCKNAAAYLTETKYACV